MVRNPVDMVYSQHSQLLFSVDENVKNFMEAYSLQDKRMGGKRIPSTCRDSRYLQYTEKAKLGKQIQRLYNTFPKNQVKIIVFDDFISNTTGVYREILKFIGVVTDLNPNFEKHNPRSENRFSIIAKILKRQPPKWVSNTVKVARDKTGIKAEIRNIINDKNTKIKVADKLTPSERSKLKKDFSNDIKLLESLINKDLSHWK